MKVGLLPPIEVQEKPKKVNTRTKFRHYAFSIPEVVREFRARGFTQKSAAREIVKQAKYTKDVKLQTAITVQLLSKPKKHMTKLLEAMCDAEGFDPGLVTIRNIKKNNTLLETDDIEEQASYIKGLKDGTAMPPRDLCYFDMKLRDALLKEKGETLNIKHEGLAGILSRVGDNPDDEQY